MNVSPTSYQNYSITSNYYTKKDYTPPSFKGALSAASSEKGLHQFEYGLRIIANKIASLFESKTAKHITKQMSEVVAESGSKYCAELEDMSRYYSSAKNINLNYEDKILERIASKNKPVIFMMNHSNQKEDPSMLAVLNTLLTRAYKEAGHEDSFQIPKIILNQDILTTMNPTKRKAFEAFGAVGIDANIFNADKSVNARAFLPLIKDFIRDKCNIFIFPEGKMAVQGWKQLEERFQPGVAELVNKVLGMKKEVTVIPVGFGYGKGEMKNLRSIQLGDPLVFKRDGTATTVTNGSILKSSFADEGFVNFFKKHTDEQNVTITQNGEPIKPENITDYIKSLLCENLNISAKEANEKLTEPIKSIKVC